MTPASRKIVIPLAAIFLLSLLLGLSAWLYLRHAMASTTGNPQQIDAFFDSTAQASKFASLPPQPCADQYPLKRAWFGALHIHTAASFDATAFGVTNTADDAYAFSRGKELELRLLGDAEGAEVPRVRIGTVLDFAAVTDHAGQLGEKRVCEDPNSKGYPSLLCNIYRGDIRLPFGDDMQPLVRLASQAIFQQRRAVQVCGEDGEDCRLEARNAWQENQQAAENWQDQSSNCEFSTFHGYEYTLAEDASNLHRNVLFASSTVPPAVVSAKDKQTPEQLWDWLRRTCTDSGTDCDVLTIPHNSNWSSGRMWYPYSYRDDLTQAQRQQYAALRQQMEPLVEIMQVKGDSECRNGLGSVFGTADEFCDFEKLRAPSDSVVDCDNEMGSGNMRLVGCLSRFSYARYALANGLLEQEKLGANPFKLGIIAATDNHNGTPTAQTEQAYMGASGTDRKASNRLRGEVEVPGGIAKGSPVRFNPGGIAGVWAEENSRQSLFAAMQRRETFGTSGPRIEPRFFSGRSIEEGLCNSSELLTEAYANGVPMGGDLPAAQPGSGSPRFLASAIRDPDSNLLQRIQIIKGWIDDQGRTHQAVYDVAGNPDNGASVNPDTCEVSGSGYHQLCSTWQDPDFDPSRSAVYYARVLENPACRWSTYQCNELPVAERPASCSDASTDKTIQERAWTSPIWYTAPE
jgi:hypothetical protein